MGWAIAGGVLGLILMFGAYRWLVGWSTARSGAVSVPTIGSRPRRLAGVPEEAPPDAKTPPAMDVLRHEGSAVVVEAGNDAPAAASAAGAPAEAVEAEAAEEEQAEVVAEGAASGVVITTVNQGSSDQGEFVEISNRGENPVALEGWKLTDEGAMHTYEFSALILAPGSTIRVHMWRGEDTETDLFVGRRNRWWNDTGDTAYLYDAAGSLVQSFTVAAVE